MLANLSILAALALQISAISIPHWGTMKDGSHIGLWQGCISGNLKKAGVELDACLHLPPEGVKGFPKNSLYALRAFTIMSAIFLFFALMCMMDPISMGAKYKKCNIMCLFIAGICSMIATIIWLAEFRNITIDTTKDKITPSYCFVFNILSGVIALVLAGYLKYY